MFKIEKNEFMAAGKVWYKDEYGNRLMIRRNIESNSFIAKFRPIKDGYSCEPINVSFPLTEGGVHLRLTGVEPYPESIREGIIALNEKLNDWVLMMQSLANLSIPSNILVQSCFSQEDIASHSMEELTEIASKTILDDLADFEELEGFVAGKKI